MRTTDWTPLLERTAALATGWLESLHERPVRPEASPAEMLEALGGPVPEGARDPLAVVEALARAAEPGLLAMPSGRFFGYVIGGGLPAAVAADWLTVAWDQVVPSAEATPAAAAAEQVALGWILELLDLPRGASGALVTGAQMANTVGLAAARNRVLAARGWDVEERGLAGAPPVAILGGAERHETIARSLRLLGFGAGSVRAIPADDQGRMRADLLAEALAEVDGPAIVCAQAGNVNTGAVDPLSDIAAAVGALRARVGDEAVWLHVDGAFGLWGRASARHRALLAGAELADSWTTDAHKWLNTPYDCGVALVAHPDSHRRAMAFQASYLPDSAAVAARSPVDYTPELSRRARGFAVYAALAQLGRRGLAEMIERCCALAARFADGLRRIDGAEVLNEVVLNQVLVRFRAPGGGDGDAHTRAVARRLREDGTCFMSDSTWRGHAAIRISVSNWSTDESDVDRALAAIARARADVAVERPAAP